MRLLSNSRRVSEKEPCSGNNISSTPIRSVLKEDPTRGLVLIAVNVDVGTMICRFAFKSSDVPPPKSGRLLALFEGTPAAAAAGGRPVDTIETSDGWGFIDYFGEFGSHAYALA